MVTLCTTTAFEPEAKIVIDHYWQMYLTQIWWMPGRNIVFVERTEVYITSPNSTFARLLRKRWLPHRCIVVKEVSIPLSRRWPYAQKESIMWSMPINEAGANNAVSKPFTDVNNAMLLCITNALLVTIQTTQWPKKLILTFFHQ